MKRFGSDQIFLNEVYPERMDVARNLKILSGEDKADSGAVLPLPFSANAQTHVEVQQPPFWELQLPKVVTLHFTEKKGWQCPERYNRASDPPKTKCNKKEELCFCQEGYRWWSALRQAEKLVLTDNSSIDVSSSSASKKSPAPRAGPQTQVGLSPLCVNTDFRPEHKVSVWTMLSDNPAYIKSALKLGRGVKRHTTTSVDMVVMELATKPLPRKMWEELTAAGFMRCTVQPIHPGSVTTRGDLKEKFAVLGIWGMTFYNTLLFLDADTLVQGPLDELLAMDLLGKPVGVTKDIRDKKWVDGFNTGVMLIHPSTSEYDRLLGLLNSGMKFEHIMADQGFLNAVYKSDWHDIGFVYNANLALYRFKKEFWESHENIYILHYTMQKPWKCRSAGPYGPICDLWIAAP